MKELRVIFKTEREDEDKQQYKLHTYAQRQRNCHYHMCNQVTLFVAFSFSAMSYISSIVLTT